MSEACQEYKNETLSEVVLAKRKENAVSGKVFGDCGLLGHGDIETAGADLGGLLVELRHPDAKAPDNTSMIENGDVGIDLRILCEVKTKGDVVYYDTGIAVKPPTGYYIEVVPRSSLAGSGYVMPHSMGIIDPGYTGNILVPLRKVEKDKPDITLPSAPVQMILRKAYVCGVQVVKSLPGTQRGAKGFGSTGKKE